MFSQLTETFETNEQRQTTTTANDPDERAESAQELMVSEVEPRLETAAGLPSGSGSIFPQAVSLPSGPATSLGMGESFTTQLSTGVATLNIPLTIPSARGGVQPTLALSYNSAGGFGIAGTGWSVGASAITRQSDRSVAKYDDQAKWHPEQDRFVFGAMELVPICTVDNRGCKGAQPGEKMPVWANGWQYSRPRVEGAFLRFFWSPDHGTWRVQGKDGTNLELGMPLDGSGYLGALESNPDEPTEISRWYLVRQYDSQGDVNNVTDPKPVNSIIYRYFQDGNTTYLSDIFYTSPAADPFTANLSHFAHHVALAYEERPDTLVSYRAGWRTEHRLRLLGVDVTSKPFQGSITDPREMVRRYHFEYDQTSHTSLLTSVQLEGRCEGYQVIENNDQTLDPSNCPRLPKIKFGYQRVEGKDVGLWDSQGYAFEPFNESLQEVANSPRHSLGAQQTGLMDINADGLPDLVVTDPGSYNGRHALFLNGRGDGIRSVGFGNRESISVQSVDGVDEGVLKFSNPNVAALDLDADGLVNLIHMPFYKRYSIFRPERTANGWTWAGRSIATASVQDVKINFVNDDRDIRVMDVNADGLVDVVFSSPTEYQTFFSLGRYPGGDGQFGQAEWTSATTADLSNDPITTCVPWSATPVRFSDPDVQIAEMNGDGFPDIVRMRSGQILYWPGRGNGVWGTGARDDCRAGDFAEQRHIPMQNAPFFGTAQPGFLLHLSRPLL